MATLTDADIKRPSQREYITSLDDTDVFVVEDVSAQKIKPITKTNAKATLGITDAEGTLADHETRLDTTELTIARQDQDLASVKQTLQQGNGATLDFSGIGSVPLDARATGRANPTVEGRTATNIVNGVSIANLGTVTFASVLDHKYFDVLHGTILTGTGSDMTVTNDTGVTADIAVINLTSIFGAGNEPTATDCAKIFSYFDGTKSIQLPARVRSVGKNLFDKSKVLQNYQIASTTGLLVVSTSYVVSDYMEIEGGESYILTGNSGARIGVSVEWFYDVDKVPIINIYDNGFSAVTGGTKATAPTNAKYLRLTLSKSLYYDGDVFVAMSTVALPYEPYQDSTLYIADNEEVRSVQSVSDTVSVVNGKHMLTKKISTPVSVLSGVAVNTTNYPTAKTGGKFAVEFTAGGTQIGIIGTDSTSGAGMLRFELATPIMTKLLTSGILQAKQNGTVYYEPYYEGSHQTDASSQITLPYTGTIDKVTGYDENLGPYEVPSTGYTLVGTTLTITGAVENEVFYVELSRSEPLAPELTVNTLNNDQVTLDSADGKYYQIGFTTTNGVPTVTATEVL